MTVWALADLHLSFGTPNKSMEIFGEAWKGWTHKIKVHCEEVIKNEDLLLIAGDISWASTLEEVMPDLEWIDSLPGTKVLIKGNHDYWWPSKKKLDEILPKSIHAIHNDVFNWEHVSIGGSRMWDSEEYSFESLSNSEGSALVSHKLDPDAEKIFTRELGRLKMSLDQLSKEAQIRIVMTHYPPIGLELQDSKTSKLLDSYNIDYCVFGHLHNVKKQKALFGKKNKTQYYLTSCDFLDFKPLKLF